MLIENKEKRKLISKWLIGIFTICILIFLSMGHINIIAKALTWLFNLFFPLILGCALALIINVPLGPIEKHLFKKTSSIKCQKIRRPLAIVLSLLLIFGIFIGIAFLIISTNSPVVFMEPFCLSCAMYWAILGAHCSSP